MIATVFRVMALSLLRDRGALALAFLLPPVIFVVLAAVFAGASGEEMHLRVAVLDQAGDSQSQRLVGALAHDGSLELQQLPAQSPETALRELVRGGGADAGLVIRRPLSSALAGDAPIHVIADRGNPIAAPMLAGRVQAIIQSELPDLGLIRTLRTVETLIGGYTERQRLRLDLTLGSSAVDLGDRSPPLLTQETIDGRARAGGTISYYAGAVAMLFLLFAAMQGATSLVDERHSGVTDRLLLGPGGTHVIVLGKGLFLVVQGVLQVTLIFLVGWLGYGVDLPSNALPWLITTVAAAIAASGLALALAIACRTRQQVQTVATFAVLVLSAVGGSMVPRFLMPAWLQQLGWLTPNAWAVDAYQAVLWRAEPMSELLPAWGVLAGSGILATLLALAMANRLARA